VLRIARPDGLRLHAMVVNPLSPAWSNLVWLPITVAAFALPGWLFSRCVGSPAVTLTTFLGSSALLFETVLLLSALGLPLRVGLICGLLATISLILGWWARHSRPAAGPAHARPPPSWPRGLDWLWVVPPSLALASVALCAVISPLSGYDNCFRWDYLARVMLARGRLDFYPPVSIADFDIYAWCDGIPPLVPMLNFWIYSFTGSAAPALTAVRVVVEALLLGTTVFGLSRRLWGPGAGWPAVAIAATSSLLVWGVAIGQETGLTALTFAGMFYFLECYREDGRRSTALWAGVAAGVGALSREYGLSYAILGLVIIGTRRQWRTAAWPFAGAAGFIAAPWFLRNWVKTGNPLFPQGLGGLFSSNPVYESTMRSIADFWSASKPHFALIFIPEMLAVLAGGVLVLGLIGAWRAGRRSSAYLAGTAMIGALWWWSIPQTGGGWVYAARVLTPALALAGSFAGWVGALPRTARALLAAVLIPLAADAARRVWFLPGYALTSPWALTTLYKPEASLRKVEALRRQKAWDVLIAAAQGRGIAVDHPLYHAEITLRGGLAVPLFSPRVAAMFDASLPFDEAVRRLRAAQVRIVALTLGGEIAQTFVATQPFLREMCARQEPVAHIGDIAIFDLDLLKPAAVSSP
jgi:hypothetical protein